MTVKELIKKYTERLEDLCSCPLHKDENWCEEILADLVKVEGFTEGGWDRLREMMHDRDLHVADLLIAKLEASDAESVSEAVEFLQKLRHEDGFLRSN